MKTPLRMRSPSWRLKETTKGIGMFDTVILIIVGLLLLSSTYLAFRVLKEVSRAYSDSVKLEQIGVVIINGLILVVVIGILIDRHVRIIN